MKTAITHVPAVVGETTITAKNRISLPAKSVRDLGSKRGDQLIVELLGDDLLVLMRRPDSWTDAFAGRLTDVSGIHEENINWLERERAGWDEE